MQPFLPVGAKCKQDRRLPQDFESKFDSSIPSLIFAMTACEPGERPAMDNIFILEEKEFLKAYIR